MAKKTNKEQRLTFRMAQEDYEKLEKRCEDAGLTKSEYLRYLVRIPLATEENPEAEHAILVDRKAMNAMSRELTKWGYHYNQATSRAAPSTESSSAPRRRRSRWSSSP